MIQVYEGSKGRRPILGYRVAGLTNRRLVHAEIIGSEWALRFGHEGGTVFMTAGETEQARIDVRQYYERDGSKTSIERLWVEPVYGA